jgi:hypothetical protein
LVIQCPNPLTPEGVVHFCNFCIRLEDRELLEIDFGTCGFVSPFSALLLLEAITEIRQRRKRAKRDTRFVGFEAQSGPAAYLRHLGLFKALGLETFKQMAQTVGVAEKFLPFTKISAGQILNKGRIIQTTIDARSEALAKVIFPGERNSSAAMMLGYSIREVMRNSFEHGGTTECTVCAQRWSTGDAEIAILDRGIGIQASLRRKFPNLTAAEAVRRALLPGITCESVTNDTKWSNSGFGLYVISQLGLEYGSFSIFSSDTLLGENFQTAFPLTAPLASTIVKLKVSIRDAEYFPNILSGIVARGEEQAKGIEGAKVDASGMSKSAVPWSGA